MADQLTNAVSSVGNVLAPEIRTPNLPGMDVPTPAPNPVDRFLPILSAISSTLREQDPVGGFIRGRAMQYDIEQNMAAPYVAQQAQLSGANAYRAQQARTLRRQMETEQNPVQKLKMQSVVDTLESGTENFHEFLNPSAPRMPTQVDLVTAVELAAGAGKANPTDPAVYQEFIPAAKQMNDARELQNKQDELGANEAMQKRLIEHRASFARDSANGGLRFGPLGMGSPEMREALRLANEARIPTDVLNGPDGHRIVTNYLPQARQNLLVAKRGGTVQDYEKEVTFVTKDGQKVLGMLPVIDVMEDPEVLAVPLNAGNMKRLQFYDGYLNTLSEIRPQLDKMEKFFADNPLLVVEMFGNAANEKSREKVIQYHPELKTFNALMGMIDVMKSKEAFSGERLTDEDRQITSGYAGSVGVDPALLKERLEEIEQITKERRGELLKQDPHQMRLLKRSFAKTGRAVAADNEAANVGVAPTNDENVDYDSMSDDQLFGGE